VGAVPGICFGLAFCEASGKRLVRWSGNDEAALALARDNALAIGAGHTFLIFLGDGFFPVNVLAAVRAVPEVCRIYCATANPTQVIVAQTELGRGVLGVVDGASPLGVETGADIAWRKDLLRKIGYKLWWLDEAEADRLHHLRLTLPRIERDEARAGIAAKIAARQVCAPLRTSGEGAGSLYHNARDVLGDRVALQAFGAASRP